VIKIEGKVRNRESHKTERGGRAMGYALQFVERERERECVCVCVCERVRSRRKEEK
jgi:hypothetical protein